MTVKFSLLVAGVGLVAATVLWYMNVIRPPKIINLQDLAPKEAVIGSSDPVYLRTLSAPDEIHRHILDGEFTIVYRMKDIPQSCIAPFEYSFLYYSRNVPKQREIDFADPGHDFNYGDAIIGDLPFRQLHFAGLGRSSCFVYYQKGGNNYPSSCLAAVNYSSGRTIWVGVTRQDARDLRKLRSLLSKHQFYDSGGRDC